MLGRHRHRCCGHLQPFPPEPLSWCLSSEAALSPSCKAVWERRYLEHHSTDGRGGLPPHRLTQVAILQNRRPDFQETHSSGAEKGL